MIHDFTAQQLRDVHVDGAKPLIICDVDDVVVHFLRAFDARLAELDHVLEANSFALSGNIIHRHTREEMPDQEIADLIDDFFVNQTEHMDAIEGAIQALLALGKRASIVMLTNLPHHAREKRIRNLRSHGLPYSVITNSGPKGPAIKDLSSRTTGPVVFVDDSPSFVASCNEWAPEVKIVHFLHDQRFAKLQAPLSYVSRTTGNWAEAHTHIEGLIA